MKLFSWIRRRRRDDLTWDEIVDFLSGPESPEPEVTLMDLAALYVQTNAETLDPATTARIGEQIGRTL